jgi:hypothetical protein
MVTVQLPDVLYQIQAARKSTFRGRPRFLALGRVCK